MSLLRELFRFDFVLLYIFVISFFCWIMSKVTPLPEDLHRKHWVPYDPVVLYDIFFGAACLMAFWRIFYYIQLNRSFGSTVVVSRGLIINLLVFLDIYWQMCRRSSELLHDHEHCYYFFRTWIKYDPSTLCRKLYFD